MRNTRTFILFFWLFALFATGRKSRAGEGVPPTRIHALEMSQLSAEELALQLRAPLPVSSRSA